MLAETRKQKDMYAMFRKKIVSAIVFLLMIGSCTLIASADQTNDSDKYTFTNYGGEVYTPEPMEFGANLKDNITLENGTERKHLLLQFYDNSTDDQLLLLEEYGVQILDVAADDTYIVSMPTEYTAADLPDNAGLRWMGKIPVENKYDHIHGLNVPEWAYTEDGQVELWLIFYEDVTYEEAQEIARKYSVASPQFNEYPYSLDCLITTNESNITIIVTEDSIESVGYPEGAAFDETSTETPGFTTTIGILTLTLIAVLKGNTRQKRK